MQMRPVAFVQPRVEISGDRVCRHRSSFTPPA